MCIRDRHTVEVNAVVFVGEGFELAKRFLMKKPGVNLAHLRV